MSQTDKKLDKFSSAVLKDAQEQREKILAEINQYRKTQMDKAEEDILQEAYILIQNEISAIKNLQSRNVSLAELNGRRKLLKQREEITGKVFDEAAARINDFTRTADYEKLMCEWIKIRGAELPPGNLVIKVKASDLPLAQKLIEACGRTAKVESSIDIALGGFTLINSDIGIVIDETLDLKLSSQKDWFAASSGLTLGF